MEDRYLFKAKKLDNGEWVQGVPFEIEGKTVILINDNENLLRVHYLEENMWDAEICAIEVETDTICQCTGLEDKNGNLIWENDIVEAWSQGSKATGKVRQRIDGLWFMYPAWQKQEFWGLCPNNDRETTVEVIGNIFDNPELLEGGE